tara:strand:- start:429 stop:932 length:504 start_codon:yes stop_codon:yes gene_type:complete
MNDLILQNLDVGTLNCAANPLVGHRRPTELLVDAAGAAAIRGTLTAAESGTTFLVPGLTGGTQTLALPAPTADVVGCYYTFLSIATVAQDLNVTTDVTATKVVGNVSNGDGDNVAIASGFNSIGFDANAVIGTFFTVMCVSTTAAVAWIVLDAHEGIAVNTATLNLA